MSAIPLDRVRGLPLRRSDEGHVLLSYAGIRFAHFLATYCVHTKGRWARTPVLLEPWQIVLFSEALRTEPGTWLAIPEEELWEDPWGLFAQAIEDPWFEVAQGRRAYRECYVQMPEKTGKSTILSGLELYLLGFDGEEGAEVYAAATTGDQAGIVFNQARQMVKRSPELSQVFQVFASVIYHGDTDSVFKALSSESEHDEGLNPHGVCIDELWAHPDRDLYDTLTSRLDSGTRLDPLAFIITNAGHDTESICFEIYAQAKAVIEGMPGARDDLFAFIPELAAEELDQPETWKLVNPQSWVTTDDLVRASKKKPPMVFRRRRLNHWTETDEAWLPPLAWEACFPADPAELEVEDGAEAYAGIDLGLRRDTAAAVLAFPRADGRILLKAMVWGLVRHDEPDPPCHVLLPGPKFDIGLVEAWVREQGVRYDLREVAYDPYRFERSAQTLGDEGLIMVEWPQTDQRMIPATEGLYEDITDQKVIVPNDPVFTAHVYAGAAVETGRGVRLSKRKAKRPMDALIGAVMGRARAKAGMDEGRPSFEVLA